MQFGHLSNENSMPLRMRNEPLRAEGNLTFREFISVVKHLWEEGHPDIKILPTQGKNFAKYPCIVWATELKKPFVTESKQKFREFVTDDEGNKYCINGQRFDHIVTFRIITENDPDLAEAIIETFEDFMLEYTPVFKRLGVSDFFYSRRISDREENRDAEDVCIRSVSYLVIVERVLQTRVDSFEEIIVRARKFLYGSSNVFGAYSGDDFITLEDHGLSIGDKVVIYSAIESGYDGLPGGYHNGWIYTVVNVDEDNLYFEDPNGNSVTATSNGQGIVQEWPNRQPSIEIEDQFSVQTAPDMP